MSCDVSAILSRMGAHLSDLAEDISRLENMASNNLSGEATARHDMIRELQTLDHQRQALNDLALLANCLASLPDQQTVSPALRHSWEAHFKMTATRDLLYNEAPVHSMPEPSKGTAQIF